MFPTKSERLISISDAFSAFVYGYPSSCPCAHCTPNKSVPTLRYTRRHGPVYTGRACRHLPSAVPWISEDRLLAVRTLQRVLPSLPACGHYVSWLTYRPLCIKRQMYCKHSLTALRRIWVSRFGPAVSNLVFYCQSTSTVISGRWSSGKTENQFGLAVRR